jgi:dipeptidyl-peptidase 4
MKLIFVVLSFFIFTCFQAQNKLTLSDAMLKARTTLAPENLKNLQFLYGTNEYVYLEKSEFNEQYVKGSFNEPEKTFITMQQAQEFFSNVQTGKLGAIPIVNFSNNIEWTTTINGYKIGYNPKTKKQRIILDKSISNKTNIDLANNDNIVYLENDNIVIMKNGVLKIITTDGSKDIVYASSVHRDEFGINKGTFWSKDGSQLAFYRMDQSMVNNYPIVDWSTNPATVENVKYPMAGGKSHQVTIGIHNTNTGKTIYLNTVKDDHYLTNICWSMDNQYIYIAEVNRTQNKMDLNRYSVASGNFEKTILTEIDEKYTEPLVPMQFLPNDNSQFLWQSNKDGYNQLYLYNIDGKLLAQITNDNADVIENKGFDVKGESLFYIATDGRGSTKKLYSYNLKTKQTKVITPVEGIHNTQISSDGTTFIDNYSNTTTPRVINIINNKKVKTIFKSANPLSGIDNTKMDVIGITNRLGDTLNVKTYYPINYSAVIKYPTIVYWYGGPHAQMVTNSWNAGAGDYWFKYMAQQGFIVIVPDVRGSDNRGKKFEQSMFQKLGEVQMQDLEDILKYYANAGVDNTRMGLFGWSFGGFMTTNFLLNHPGIFKAGVAGGPVMDWSLYEIMYTERYMDTPAENPNGYAATNLINQVGKLKDKLLLIHGLQDNVVVQQHSVNFVKAAVDKGIQVDYMIYPGHEHNVTGKDRLHLYQKITDYFMLHLK